MVQFTQLSIQNFKRFSGRNVIDLNPDEGRLTVIAAKNGLGKTSILESIHLALYGKRGFLSLYPNSDYFDWIRKAFSVEPDSSEKLSIVLTMKDPAIGEIRITRTYWMSDGLKDSEIEEFHVSIEGKPLVREGRISLLEYSNNWIEDYLPQSAMRKFLVDGERLDDLNPKEIDAELVKGIDDVTGIGLLHRLRRHLNALRKSTLSSMVPDEIEFGVGHLTDMLASLREDQTASELALVVAENRLKSNNERIVQLQNEIETLSKDGGAKNVELRMEYAIRQSELTSSRKEVHTLLMESLPFLVAGVPGDLENWDFSEILSSKKTELEHQTQLSFLREVIDASGVGVRTSKKLLTSGSFLLSNSEVDELNSPFNPLPISVLESVSNRHLELGLSDAAQRTQDAVTLALDRLTSFLEAESALRAATVGLGIGEKADELRELAKSLGTDQAAIAQLKGQIEQYKVSRADVEKRIHEIRQREDADSYLNRRLTRIDELELLTDSVLDDVRTRFSKPLREAFEEGFELLSRKSSKLEGVSIDPSDYSLTMNMRGFEGNWLDRDLSATEKQHVGLALVFALRRASTDWSLPLPVVIDTPTSRMDLEHKSWSVKNFYPMLSNQVIVLATSDDLAGGLYEELAESGVLGNQLLIEEVSDNSVKVTQSNLEEFFRL